ncbi:MAG: branched-chain amino acid transaminase [Myxococcales bacterium]|nr:branched-chain amino acid transaminase [Myxococcales bacterium]
MAKYTPEKYIWLDGKLVPWNDATVHVLTHTLHYGVGVFEGVRAYEQPTGGGVFRLPEHIDRLLMSARMCLIDSPYSRDQLIQACVETLRENGLRGAYLRPLMFLGDGAMGLGATEMAVRIAISTYVWGTYLGEDGVRSGIRAKVSSFARASQQSSLLKAKICGQYVNSVLAKREVVRGGYDEAILLDSTGQVAEASGENIFAVIRGHLLTPPLSGAILDGITRDSVLTLARDLGIPADERPLSRDQLYMADEVFLTGTAAEITPVREIDDRRIGSGRPGPITQKLQATFHDVVRGRLPQYQHWITPV